MGNLVVDTVRYFYFYFCFIFVLLSLAFLFVYPDCNCFINFTSIWCWFFFVVSNELKLEKYIVPQKLYKDLILSRNIWFIINMINITIWYKSKCYDITIQCYTVPVFLLLVNRYRGSHYLQVSSKHIIYSVITISKLSLKNA